jgi:hypothetical protein
VAGGGEEIRRRFLFGVFPFRWLDEVRGLA